MKPYGAQHLAYGSWFKEGSHNFLMRWDGLEWVRSSLHVSDVRRETRSAKPDRKPGSGRGSIPLVDGKKECRGKYGCGQYKPVEQFPRDSKGYRISNCRDCQNRRLRNYKRAA